LSLKVAVERSMLDRGNQRFLAVRDDMVAALREAGLE
jgi:hypothetical protein